MDRVDKRIAVELRIVEALVDGALKRGFRLNVDNGGDGWELPVESEDRAAILDALMATDEEHLFLFNQDGKRIGYFFLVYGNGDGTEVVCDYTDKPVLEEIFNEEKDQLEEQVRNFK